MKKPVKKWPRIKYELLMFMSSICRKLTVKFQSLAKWSYCKAFALKVDK